MLTTVNPETDANSIAPASGPVLAIFDLDKTIIDTSASMAYSRPLAEAGLISTGEVLRMMAMLGNYMLTTHSEQNMEATKENLLAMMEGRDADSLRQVTRDALQDVITPYIYSEARELLEWHREQGHDIAIVTASPSIMVEPIAEELGTDRLIATELEVIDGKFTGKVLHFNKGQAKVDKLRELVTEYGYDLDASYAYSDSATDIPMLEMVGNPTAVNPDRPLRKEAAKREWPTKKFQHPEPLFQQPAVLAGAGATLALLGIVATSIAVWLGRKDEG